MLPLYSHQPRRKRISLSLGKGILNYRPCNWVSAFLLLLGVLSVFLNVHYYLSASTVAHPNPNASLMIPHSISETISHDLAVSRANHLVIVPGHGIWKGCDPAWRGDSNEWTLGPEAQDQDASVRLYFSHIVRGAEVALDDPRALIIFSGGQTRPDASYTEGQSYYRLAHESNVFKSHPHPFDRSNSEDFALDSFQNLLFSIARFHEVTGHYPEHITVVGFAMKEKRFRELHRAALRWPEDHFDYIGIDLTENAELASEGEYKFGYMPFTQDPYGCHSQLVEKRRRRNPFSRYHPYHTSSPELQTLFDWCPDRAQTFPGPLPWDL